MDKETTIANEEGVISAVLDDPSIFQDLSDFITPECFYVKQFGWAWEAFAKLHEAKQGIDAITVGDALDKMGKLKGFSNARNTYYGRMALDELRRIGDPRNATTYASGVLEHHAKRLIKTEMEKGATWSMNGRSASDTITDLMTNLAKIKTLDSKSATRTQLLKDALRDAMDATERARTGEIVAVPTGIADLDRALGGGLFAPDFIIIGGRPGDGKTSLMTTIARNAAVKGKRVLFLTLEMANSQIAMRLITMESGVPFSKQRSGKIDELEYPKYTHGIGVVGSYAKNIILNDIPALTIAQLRQEIRRAGTLDLIVFDYIQLGGVESKNQARYLDVGELSRGMKSTAKEFGIPVVAGAQLSRESEKSNRKPIKSDLRESGSLEQDTDIIIFIHKEDDLTQGPQYKLIIAKQRNGPVGEIDVVFLPKKMQFVDATTTRETFGNKQ